MSIKPGQDHDMLSDDQIRDAFVNGFRPLRCVVEIFDYDQKLRFRVLDTNDNGIVRGDGIVLRELRDPSNLRSVLASARAVVEEKGFRVESL